MCESCESNPSLEAYYHGCQNCGTMPDEEGNCNCPPERYIPPGREAIMYVNAYEVTRHYGGREEGGWWYNHLEPIASMPVKAISVDGHGDECWTCNNARKGMSHEGEKYELCKWSYRLMPIDPTQVEMFKEHLKLVFKDRVEGDIYSVLGGTELMVVLEEYEGTATPRPHYE